MRKIKRFFLTFLVELKLTAVSEFPAVNQVGSGLTFYTQTLMLTLYWNSYRVGPFLCNLIDSAENHCKIAMILLIFRTHI